MSQRVPSISLEGSSALDSIYCKRAGLWVNRKGTVGPCLAQCCLGKPKDSDLKRRPPHHLYDFKLYVPDMEELKLPVHHYVTTMAKGLAFLHWECRVDSDGVKFMLGQPDGRPPIISSPFLGDHTMWMIDYDRCCPASMDEAGAECMITAVLKKNHQYPLPFSSDATVQDLWSAFSLQYLRSSLSFIEIRHVNRHEKDRMTCLAQKVLKGIELACQMQAKLENQREE